MKRVIDVALRWNAELEEMNLDQLYYLKNCGAFLQSENKYVREMGKMVLERIEVIERVA